jgi:hypothetical protein
MSLKHCIAAKDAGIVKDPVVGDIVINVIDDLTPKSKHDVFYVSQDNYVVTYYDGFSPALKLYADSATSCVIIIVVGKDRNGKNLIAMAHLSRPGRFQYFFNIVALCFCGEVQAYASGANPAEPIPTKLGVDYTAFRNANITIDWVKEHRISINELPSSATADNFQIKQATLSFGQGNPSIYANNLDCFGIQTKDASVSKDREWLASANEQNATVGIQTLFCMYGDKNLVRPQSRDFTQDEIDELIEQAKRDTTKNLSKVANMSDADILQTYSSTPEFEVPWFCDTIRAAAKCVYP